MRASILAVILVLSFSSKVFGHGDHGHHGDPIDAKKAEIIANQIVAMAVKKGKTEASWKGKRQNSSLRQYRSKYSYQKALM